jgi:hypothetical protein
VAADARSAQEGAAALLNRGVGRRRLALLLHPAGKLLGGLDDDAQQHVRVLGATVLSTLTEVRARRERLYPRAVGSVGDHVGLARKPRDPEAMGDVGGLEGEPRGSVNRGIADRDVELVGSDDAELGVTDLPPPLPSDDRHFDRGRSRASARR